MLSPATLTIALVIASATFSAVGCAQSENGGQEEANRNGYASKSTGQIADVSPAALASGDWKQFLGPNGDSTSPEQGIDPSAWTPYPRIVWTTKIGESYGAPTIANGRLYQFDRYGNAERLTCYDANTGVELWIYEYDSLYRDAYGYNNGPRTSPLIDDGHAYLFGVTGILTCVNLGSHEAVWQIDTAKQYRVIGNFFGVAANPVVHNDKLLVMVGGSPKQSQGLSRDVLQLVQPNNCAVVAFDKSTGKEQYRVGDDLASYASICVHKVGERELGLAFLRGGLLAWDVDTGNQAFEFPWRANMRDSVNAAMPLVHENHILLSEAYEIGSVLLDCTTDTPEVVWKDAKKPRSKNNFRAHWSTPVLVDGYLYGGHGRNEPDADFRCIDFLTGEVKWKFWRHERSSVLAIDGYLIALGEAGTLKLLKPTPDEPSEVCSVDLNSIPAENGNPLLRSPCWAAPIVAGGKLYLRGRDRLVCMQLIGQP